MKSRVFLIAMLLCSTSGLADFRSGNELVRDCTSSSSGTLFCLGYIAGVADSMLGGTNEVNGFRACVSPQVEAGQLRDIVVGFLQKNLATRHLGADGLVAHALAD